VPLHFHTSPLSTLRTPQRPQVFISDIRACANAEQEQVRVDKELAKIRKKFAAGTAVTGEPVFGWWGGGREREGGAGC